MTITVPDGKAIRITYSARIKGALGATVSYSNTAKVTGYNESVHSDGTLKFSTDAQGSG